MIEGIENRIVPIDLLKAHPRNYRVHPEEQISNLCSSYRRFGQFRSVVAVPDGQGYIMVAGHGFVEAMRREGATDVRVECLPVNTPAVTIEAIMVADNLHAQSAEDDQEILAQLLQSQADAGFSLESMGSSEDALNALLESLDGAMGDDEESGDGSEDAMPEDVETRCKLGDVWQLGKHTIACLDSTDRETYKKLLRNVDITFIWSDPPYGISIVRKDGHIGSSDMRRAEEQFGKKIDAEVTVYAPVIGDDSKETARSSFDLCRSHYPKALQIWWGANHYSDGLPSSSCWLVWDKENEGTGFADAELAWCSHKGAVRIFRHKWNGMLRDSEQGIKRVHPNQKPIAMAEHFFEKYGQESDIIFDPFLGSGISVIAAENLGRTVIGCELSPEYCSIVIARWEQHTGQTAQLLDRIEDPSNV